MAAKPVSGPARRRTLVLFGNSTRRQPPSRIRETGVGLPGDQPADLDPPRPVKNQCCLRRAVAGDLAVVSYNVPRHGPDEMARQVKAYFASVARVMRGKAFSSMVLSGGDVGRAVLGLGLHA